MLQLPQIILRLYTTMFLLIGEKSSLMRLGNGPLVRLKVRAVHDGCWSTDERIRSEMRILDFRIMSDNRLRMLIDKEDKDTLLNPLKKTYNLFIVNGMSKYGRDKLIISFIKSIQEISVPKLIDQYHGFFLGSVYKNGIEEWNFVIPAREVKVVLSNMNLIMSRMEIKADDYDPVSVAALNSQELEILNTAYELGYFDFPRETDLKELSRRLNMSKSTVSYHLRNIERKILSNILKDYNRGLVSKVSEE